MTDWPPGRRWEACLSQPARKTAYPTCNPGGHIQSESGVCWVGQAIACAEARCQTPLSPALQSRRQRMTRSDRTSQAHVPWWSVARNFPLSRPRPQDPGASNERSPLPVPTGIWRLVKRPSVQTAGLDRANANAIPYSLARSVREIHDDVDLAIVHHLGPALNLANAVVMSAVRGLGCAWPGCAWPSPGKAAPSAVRFTPPRGAPLPGRSSNGP